MLTALLLERILRHKVVDPFPEEGTYHDRWYRDRRRRRVNAQWHRRLLSPTRDRGRKSWCRPEPPALVVTDEDGREYRQNFPSFKPLAREIETQEDYRVDESTRGKHLLQVPGKGADKTYFNCSSKASRHGGVAFSEEGKSRLNASYVNEESRRFDRNYENKESLASVGQGERRENTARENTHGDGYRLHETSINLTSKGNKLSPKGERDHEACLETSSSKQQIQGFGGRYAGEKSVLSEGHQHRTKEREISARENSHDDGNRLRYTSINKKSRILITEERQERRFDRRYAEGKSVPSVGQPDKAVERENNNGDENRLRHTPIIPTARHDTESFSKENRSHTEVSSDEREQERFDRNYLEEERANSRGQGEKQDGGRQSVGFENKHGDDYRLRNSTSKQGMASPREEREPSRGTSSYERQEQRLDKQYVEEEPVPSNGKGRYTVKEVENVQNNDMVHTTSRHTTASHTEEHKSNREQSSYERQEQRFDKQNVEGELVPSNGQGRHTVKQPESTRNNDYSLVHTTSRQATASHTEEHKSNRVTSSYERQEQRFDKKYVEGRHTVNQPESTQNNDYGLVHTTSRQTTGSHNGEHKSYREQSSYERQEQHFDGQYVTDESLSSTRRVEYTVKSHKNKQKINYGDENRLVHTAPGQNTTPHTEEHRSYLEPSSVERKDQRYDDFVPSTGQKHVTAKESERVQNNIYGDETRLVDTTSKYRAESRNEERELYLETSSYESQRHRTETHQEEEISVPSSSQDDHTFKEPERVRDKSYSSTTFKHSTVSSNEEHRSNLDGSFCEIHGCPFGHFSGQQDTAKDWETHDYGDGYRLRHKAMRALAEEIKELLAEIRTSRVQTSTTSFERYQQQRSDRYDLQEDVVHSMSQGGKTEELEYNDGDRYRLRNTPTHEEDIKDGTTFCDDVSHGKHVTRTSGVSEVRVTEESVGYEDLLQDEGNQRQKASHSSSETLKHITVSVDEERKTYLETTSDEKQEQRHRGKEEFETPIQFEPPSRGQGDKDGGRENNNGDAHSLRHTPTGTISETTTVSPTENHTAYTDRESYHIERNHVEEEEKEQECWHSKCQHGRAVDWETLARENDKNGNKSRLIRVPIKVALREVYTDKWRQYMNVCQESEVETTDSDEKSTQAVKKDHETYVSQRKINLINQTGDAWREQHPQGKNGEPSTEGDLEGEYKVRRREGEDSRYTSVFEYYNEDAWQDTEDSRHISVFEENEGEDEESWQQKQGKSADDSLSYTSQRRLEEETEESRHRSVFENDHREEEGRNAFFEEWSSLRYTEVSAADFAEWSWLLTTDPRAREDLSEDGEAPYDNSSADYLAKRRQRLMDIVDGLDEEQLSRLEWFLRQVCLLEEDVNHSLDRRSFDFSEFRADLEFVSRTYFDIELRDLEDSRHDYLSDEDTDLETIPESDHEYDADDDGYEMSPSPAPLTSSRVDLHNISTTKGLKRWDSRDSAIGSSVGGTLRSWGSQSTVDGASETSGYRLSLDSDVFYFGDMSKYGRRSFGSTPYLSRESYC